MVSLTMGERANHVAMSKLIICVFYNVYFLVTLFD